MSPGPTVWHWGESLRPLIAALDEGRMLAIPTESTYGLSVDPRDAGGVETVLRFKHRPPSRALPVVLGDIDQLRSLGGDPD